MAFHGRYFTKFGLYVEKSFHIPLHNFIYLFYPPWKKILWRGGNLFPWAKLRWVWGYKKIFKPFNQFTNLEIFLLWGEWCSENLSLKTISGEVYIYPPPHSFLMYVYWSKLWTIKKNSENSAKHKMSNMIILILKVKLCVIRHWSKLWTVFKKIIE